MNTLRELIEIIPKTMIPYQLCVFRGSIYHSRTQETRGDLVILNWEMGIEVHNEPERLECILF